MAHRLAPSTSTSGYTTTASSNIGDLGHRQSVEETDVEEGYEDETDTGTGVYRPQRRIVLTKRTYLLVAFVIIHFLGIVGIVSTIQRLNRHDLPPTTLSYECFVYTILAVILVTAVSPVGFVILKFRIANLTIGFGYMFALVLCIIFAAKGISGGYYSYKHDNQYIIAQFAASNASIREQAKLHPFWAAVQRDNGCCGTKDIDRVEDWSTILNTTDLPASCCSKTWLKWLESDRRAKNSRAPPQSVRHSCAKGLGRTRTRYINRTSPLLPKRIHSGFFLSLTKYQTQVLSRQFGVVTDPERFIVEQNDNVDQKIKDDWPATKAFAQTWNWLYLDSIWNSLADMKVHLHGGVDADDFIHEVDTEYDTQKMSYRENDISVTKEKNPNEAGALGLFRNVKRARTKCESRTGAIRERLDNTSSASLYCANIIPDRKRNVTTMGRELLRRLDYLTSYIYELATDSMDDNLMVPKGTWVLWRVPTAYDPKDSVYPYKLAANLYRVHKTADEAVVKANAKRMYYLSRGISENYALQQVLHEKVCEGMDEDYRKNFKTKVARDINKRWRTRGPVATWTNPEDGLGLYFKASLQDVVLKSIIASIVSILCATIIAIIFWQYYARIKAEEYSNLALPKEFEVLHLRRGSTIDTVDIVTTGENKGARPVAGNKVAPVPSLRKMIPSSQSQHQHHHQHATNMPSPPAQQIPRPPQQQMPRPPPQQMPRPPPQHMPRPTLQQMPGPPQGTTMPSPPRLRFPPPQIGMRPRGLRPAGPR